MAGIGSPVLSNVPSAGLLSNLTQAVEGRIGAIRLMICRLWRIISPTGQHTSTEFLASDQEGNIVQICASGSCSEQFEQDMVEGKIHRVEGFTVEPINPLYVNWNLNTHALHLTSDSTVAMLECPTNGFVRYPFTLADLEDIRDNKASYIVDVIGMATNVGELSATPIGAPVLQFDIVNERGAPLRTMIWGELATVFLNKRETINGDHVMILTSLQPREFRAMAYICSSPKKPSAYHAR